MPNGMKGFIGYMKHVAIHLEENMRQSDADTQAEFEKLIVCARRNKGVSREICEEFYEQKKLPYNIRRHCIAVGETAAKMAEKLIKNGIYTDVELCRSGGYLHDLCKLESEHEKAVGIFLRKCGYERLASVTEAHNRLSKQPTISAEESIVFLADKLIREDTRVTIDERYKRALQMQEIKPWIWRNIEACRALLRQYKSITGSDFEKEEK